MFRSSTLIREPALNLAKVIFMLKHSVKLRRYLLCGCVAACMPEGVVTVQREFNPYPTAFPYGNGMVLHFYQQQESSTTKTVHKVINKRLKTYV